jgi:hypothetical protein
MGAGKKVKKFPAGIYEVFFYLKTLKKKPQQSSQFFIPKEVLLDTNTISLSLRLLNQIQRSTQTITFQNTGIPVRCSYQLIRQTAMDGLFDVF